MIPPITLPNKLRGRSAVLEVLLKELLRLSKKGTVFILMVSNEGKKKQRLSIMSRGKFFVVYDHFGGGWWKLVYQRR